MQQGEILGGPTDLAPLLDVTNPRAECFPSQKHMDHRSRSLRPVGEEGLPESIHKMFQLFHSSGALPRLTIPAQRTRRKPITVYTDASSDHHQMGIGFVFIDTEPNETRLMSDGATPPELLELFGARGSVINRAEPRHRVPRPQAHAAVPVNNRNSRVRRQKQFQRSSLAEPRMGSRPPKGARASNAPLTT